MHTIFRKFIFCLSFFCFLSVTKGQQASPSLVLQYLKQKVKVFYTGRPNDVMNFSVQEISTDIISAKTDGIVFGRGGNNRMSTSARFLLNLLKDRNNGGDGYMQDWVYQILKIKDKPVNLYFFNDVMLPITEMAAFHTGLDTTRRDGGLRVFPAVWGNNNDIEAGNIQIGEYIFEDDLNLFKNTFIELISYAAIGSYRTLHNSGIYYFSHSGLDNTVFYCSEALMDYRFNVDQAICMAMARTYDTARQRLLYNWVTRPSVTIKRNLPAGVTEANISRFWLLNQGQYTGLSSLLSVLPMPPFSPRVSNNNGWFNFSNQETRNETGKLYKLRNEVTLAVIFNFIIRKEGLPKFLDIIKYNNSCYLSAPYAAKLPLILENAMRVLMAPLTPEQLRNASTANKRYLSPIALVHFFSGRSPDFNYGEFSRYVGPGFPEELFNLYTPNVRSAIGALNLPAKEPDAWYEVRDEIYRLLTNN